MKKRIVSILVVVCMFLCMLPVSALAVEKPEHFLRKVDQKEYVPEDYTAIYSSSDLMSIEANPDGNYILMEDIRLSGNWEGLCSEEVPFTGVFDGNGHTVSNMSGSFQGEGGEHLYWGFFSRVNGGQVLNLRVKGSVSFTVEDVFHKNRNGRVYMGGIAGYVEDAHIYNCVSEVSISDNQDVGSAVSKYNGYGGIVGAGMDSKVEYCRNRGTLDTYTESGGIVGDAEASFNIHACLNEGSVTGCLNVGGIAGNAGNEVTISSCANEGETFAEDATGGIVGESKKGTVVSDCLNTGRVKHDTASGGFTCSGGITRGRAQVYRTISIGSSYYGAIHAGNGGHESVTENCYWLEGSTFALNFAPDAGFLEDNTGMLTAEEMKKEESFEGLSFPDVWTLEEGMDHPYPTALLDREIENPYKKAYVENLLRDIEEDERYLWIFGGSGEGSLSGVLADTYEEAGLHVWNRGWTAINYLSQFCSFDFDIQNDFDILLADLMMAEGGMELFEELAGTEVLGYYSDMITHLCNSVEGISTLEDVVKALESAADVDSTFSSQAQSLITKTNGLMSKHISMGDVGKAFTFLGCVTDTVGAGVESAQDLIDFYSLVNAYASAGDNMGEMLRDISAAANSVKSNTGKATFMQMAINNFTYEMESSIDGDPLALYNRIGQEIVDLGQTGANCIVNICSGFSQIMPVAAGIKMGLNMGVFFGDQLTNMDSVAYYGTMMDMAGYFAKCVHKVALDYRSAFEADPTYENALKVNSINELYLHAQYLSCQYAYYYSMALAEKSITDKKYHEHFDAAVKIMEYQDKISDLIDYGNVITVDPDGGIFGFLASCPVTVIVEDERGNEIARLESGKETRAEGYADYYLVFGEDMDSKAGLYGEDQSLRIIGEGEGTMDLLLFEAKDGEITGERYYEAVPVSAGDEIVPEANDLVVNGTERIKPQCLASHSWDDGETLIEPGCTDEGELSFVCTLCGETGVEIIPALGHDWDEGEITKEPSTSEEGEKLYTCARCGETKTETIEKIEIIIEPFKDVAEDAYYYESVQWAVRRGITTGVGSGLFAPNQGCTRGQVVTFLWRAAGEPQPERGENPFADVKPSDFYYEAVLWAVEQGITSGVSATSFAPNATCTRGQIVTFLYRAFGEPELEGGVNPFRDIRDADYYYDAVLWAVERGITTGMSPTSFAPSATCTRAQIVTFLYRSYNS